MIKRIVRDEKRSEIEENGRENKRNEIDMIEGNLKNDEKGSNRRMKGKGKIEWNEKKRGKDGDC